MENQNERPNRIYHFHNAVGQFIEHVDTVNFSLDGDGKFHFENVGQVNEEMKGESGPALKDAILDYVKRLMPVVREEYKSVYLDMWLGILDLKEVRQQVYNKGKQQGTSFNRDFVAQIIHQLGQRIYTPEANTVVMAEYLEPEKGRDHPVRQKLGEMPEKVVGKAIEKLVKDKI